MGGPQLGKGLEKGPEKTIKPAGAPQEGDTQALDRSSLPGSERKPEIDAGALKVTPELKQTLQSFMLKHKASLLNWKSNDAEQPPPEEKVKSEIYYDLLDLPGIKQNNESLAVYISNKAGDLAIRLERPEGSVLKNTVFRLTNGKSEIDEPQQYAVAAPQQAGSIVQLPQKPEVIEHLNKNIDRVVNSFQSPADQRPSFEFANCFAAEMLLHEVDADCAKALREMRTKPPESVQSGLPKLDHVLPRVLAEHGIGFTSGLKGDEKPTFIQLHSKNTIPEAPGLVALFGRALVENSNRTVYRFSDLKSDDAGIYSSGTPRINDTVLTRYSHSLRNRSNNSLWNSTTPAELIQMAETDELASKILEEHYDVDSLGEEQIRAFRLKLVGYPLTKLHIKELVSWAASGATNHSGLRNDIYEALDPIEPGYGYAAALMAQELAPLNVKYKIGIDETLLRRIHFEPESVSTAEKAELSRFRQALFNSLSKSDAEGINDALLAETKSILSQIPRREPPASRDNER